MIHRSSPFLRATLTLIGTIIGAGVCALPIAMDRVGILTGSVVYWLLVFAVLAAHLLYVEVILAKPSLSKKRMPGQAGEVLGPWAQRITFITQPLHIIGACLIYLILGGEFLSVIGEALGVNLSLLSWQLLFWIGSSVVVMYGLKVIVKVETVLTWLLILTLLALSIVYGIDGDGARFLQADWSSAFLVVGAFLFSTFGIMVIPEIVDVCERKADRTRLVVSLATLVSAFFMWVFAVFTASAIPGIRTASELAHALPAGLFWLLPLVGFLAVATSFLTQVQDLRATFERDAKMSKWVSFALAIGAPILLLLFLTRDFLSTVGFVGGVLSSVTAITVALMAVKLKRAVPMAIVVAVVFLLALIHGILFSVHL